MNETLARRLGKAARTARQTLALTQEEVAERVGVTTEFYARIERGGSLPSVKTLVGIIGALDVSADDLLGTGRGDRVNEPRSTWRGDESPEVRRLIRRVKKARTRTVQLLNLLIKELERPRRGS